MTSAEHAERYELFDRIAVGGMAEVFRAKAFGAHGFEKTLAIKRILPDLASDPEFESRFIAEAKLAVDLAHANVVQVLDFGRVGGTLFIAMELIDGLDLAALLKVYRDRGERVPVAAALHIAIELAKGLEFAHQRGVVHRDVSPSNVLLSRAGEVKIADFGIAQAVADRPSVSGSRRRIMGKFRYMSPEQARGESLGARSDLFSAGVVLYELFTGEKLFPGDEAEEIIGHIQNMTIPPPSSRRSELPPRLDTVLLGMLERSPDKRPRRAAELVRALTELSYDNSIVATALDVAEAVAHALPEPGDGPGGDAAAAARRDIDALIRAQLSSGGGGGDLITRRTEAPTEAASGAPVDAPRHTESATIVKRGVGADGVTQWEPEEATVAAVPSALRGERASLVAALASVRRQRRRLATAAIGVVALVAGWRLYALVGGGDRMLAVAHADAGATTDAPATPGHLSIDSDPPGSHVRVDSAPLAAVTPTTAEVGAGMHRVEIDKDGYQRWTDDRVVVHAGETVRMRPTLDPLRASLRVDSHPDGAEVKLDGVLIGTTPLSRADLAPGPDRALLIDKPEYKPVNRTIDLRDTRPTVVDETLEPLVRYGKIDLFIEQGWAEVYLGDKHLARASVQGLRLPVGRHVLRLYNPRSKVEKTLEVEVVEGKVGYYKMTGMSGGG